MDSPDLFSREEFNEENVEKIDSYCILTCSHTFILTLAINGADYFFIFFHISKQCVKLVRISSHFINCATHSHAVHKCANVFVIAIFVIIQTHCRVNYIGVCL